MASVKVEFEFEVNDEIAKEIQSNKGWLTQLMVDALLEFRHARKGDNPEPYVAKRYEGMPSQFIESKIKSVTMRNAIAKSMCEFEGVRRSKVDIIMSKGTIGTVTWYVEGWDWVVSDSMTGRTLSGSSFDGFETHREIVKAVDNLAFDMYYEHSVGQQSGPKGPKEFSRYLEGSFGHFDQNGNEAKLGDAMNAFDSQIERAEKMNFGELLEGAPFTLHCGPGSEVYFKDGNNVRNFEGDFVFKEVSEKLVVYRLSMVSKVRHISGGQKFKFGCKTFRRILGDTFTDSYNHEVAICRNEATGEYVDLLIDYRVEILWDQQSGPKGPKEFSRYLEGSFGHFDYERKRKRLYQTTAK